MCDCEEEASGLSLPGVWGAGQHSLLGVCRSAMMSKVLGHRERKGRGQGPTYHSGLGSADVPDTQE